MTKGGGRRKRRVSSVEQRFQIKVYCEGDTEENYLNYWRQEYRDKTVVTIAPNPHTASLDIVKLAAKHRAQELGESKRDEDGDPYNEYWCFFDVDDDDKNGKLNLALELAERENIYVALSNPCLELWFLLHMENQTGYIDRGKVQSLVYKKFGCEKPHLPPAAMDMLSQNFGDAKGRALKLDQKHEGDGTKPPWNPSSNVWALVEKIRSGK